MVENVTPHVDGGRFPIKRVVGERVGVEADVFTDGHDLLGCVLLHRPEGESAWLEAPMELFDNDRWRGSFAVQELGRHLYSIEAWVDHFATWSRDLAKRLEAGQEVRVELRVGVDLVEAAERRAAPEVALRLRELRARLAATGAVPPELEELMRSLADRRLATRHESPLVVVVDPVSARFSTWYELFPRSTSPEPGQHGTFKTVEARLPEIAAMGFDVLYLPPIHPIGVAFRKGRNNAVEASRQDVGSPWAIGGKAGGHRSIHPRLGTASDFRRLVRRAEEMGLRVALDLAYQCSPDHPYVRDHPEWFRRRPDGSIQYAENPPKKYQDIYPLDFECESWPQLWEELRGVVEHWIGQGVGVFRVDNPHTKPFRFWEWLIGGIKAEHPGVIFLAEAFTRPKVMHHLAKLGFDQSYTYFTWRTSGWELREYFTELTQTPVREFFRPNLWPNTPDILPHQLQTGGPAAFALRLVLAATLGASYGIYGPAFEQCEGRPLEAGKEEYLDSEKYQLRRWDEGRPGDLRELISIVNRARRENPALQMDHTLRFHGVDNENLIAYSKRSSNGDNVILTIVNLDPHHVQAGWLSASPWDLGVESFSYPVHDLLTEARYQWQGGSNYVQLDPASMPAHILRINPRP